MSQRPEAFIERKLDISKYVPECKGTGDFIAIGCGKLVFADLKYGKGVKVEVEQNGQLMIYVGRGLSGI